jgi:hypothetical protein
MLLEVGFDKRSCVHYVGCLAQALPCSVIAHCRSYPSTKPNKKLQTVIFYCRRSSILVFVVVLRVLGPLALCCVQDQLITP